MDWMLWKKDVVLLAAAFGILKEGLFESAGVGVVQASTLTARTLGSLAVWGSGVR